MSSPVVHAKATASPSGMRVPQFGHHLRNVCICGCFSGLPICGPAYYFSGVGERGISQRHNVLALQHYYPHAWYAIGIRLALRQGRTSA
jgi:hypothetical protein